MGKTLGKPPKITKYLHVWIQRDHASDVEVFTEDFTWGQLEVTINGDLKGAVPMNDDEISQILQSDAEETKRPPGLPVLQYVIRPSFQGPAVIDVYERRRDKGYLAIRSHDAKPNQVELPKDEFERLYNRVCSAPLSVLLPNGPMGLDGTVHELWIRKGALSCRMVWWQEMPHEWGELRSAVVAMTSYLRDQLK